MLWVVHLKYIPYTLSVEGIITATQFDQNINFLDKSALCSFKK